jgi:hypothetical protein
MIVVAVTPAGAKQQYSIISINFYWLRLRSGQKGTFAPLFAELLHLKTRSRNQIAKSVYSGFTASAGGNNMPAATVALVPCSMRMNEPVKRLVV